MPLPWKKMKKNTRLSQMLSDSIHQRRKGGGSPLVVETGFPTSLIDLFVQNKERLKKPTKKTKLYPPPLPSHPPRFTNASVDDDDHHDSLICPSPSSSSSGLNMYSSRSSSPFHHSPIIDVVEGKVRQDGVDANRVLVAIFRMFLVVVLVLGMNNFVVGITVSAFLLVFLECLGKQTDRLLVPCTWMKNKLSREKVNAEQDELLSLPSCVPGSENRNRDLSMSERIREINSLSVYHNEEIVDEKEKIDDGEALNLKKVNSEEEKRCELGELKTRKSRRARIKLKMKELVPKKFRSSRKKGREVEKEKSLVIADILAAREEDEDDEEEDNPSDSSYMSREMDMIDSNNDYEQSLNAEIIPVEEKIRTEHKSEYAILVLIVLVGLICGRVFALMLALTWCLMKKSGGNLRQYYIKTPILGSVVKGSS